MRTILFLAGLLLMASALIAGKLLFEHFPSAPNWALEASLAWWLAVTGVNMWIAVSKVGYSVAEKLLILVLLFAVPPAAAV
ncbi:MAG TPA: hypothetical protein VF182_13995 [Candidatus Binatia bacterium]